MGKGGVSDALWMHGFAMYSTVVYDFWPDLPRQQDGRSQCMIFSPLYDCESVLSVIDMVNDVAVKGPPTVTCYSHCGADIVRYQIDGRASERALSDPCCLSRIVVFVIGANTGRLHLSKR
jgi:hypothetical protein